MSSAFLLFRLALATGVVLAPGALLARALGVRGMAPALGFGLTLVFGATAITFLVGGSLTLTLGLLVAAGAAGLALARLRPPRRSPAVPLPPRRLVVWLAGGLLGVLLWYVAGEVGGDGLFHLARVRKLLVLDDLSLSAVNEFADGGLHPGYAFPLWHAFLALVAKVSFADPSEVVLHEASVLAPVAVVVAYEAAYALFRRAAAAAAAAAAGVALAAMAPGHGGAYTALALPATASRQLLVPAALALALLAARTPTRGLLAATAAAAFVLAVVHPTYALFLCVPFAGFLLVRLAWRDGGARAGGLALGALIAPAAAFFAWLLPLVRDTASVSPNAAERARSLAQYAGQLDVRGPGSFSLAPEVIARSGAVAVAALLLVPLAAFATRRRWAAYVVGGSLAVFAITLVPWVFTPFSDLVSLSQARRLGGFVPFSFAFAGGMSVLAALAGPFAAPLALAGGIVLQWRTPGDFGYRLEGGGPAWVTWVAVAGALVAVLVGLRHERDRERAAGLACAVFLLPVFAAGLADWSPSPRRPPSPLTPELVAALRNDVPAGEVVYADLESSYRIAAFAPVYVCNAPPGHVADTVANRPYERREEARRFFRTGDLSIPAACGARFLVVDRNRFDLAPDLPVVYRDERYTLYRLV